jgi:hypothetical protein
MSESIYSYGWQHARAERSYTQPPGCAGQGLDYLRPQDGEPAPRAFNHASGMFFQLALWCEDAGLCSWYAAKIAACMCLSSSILAPAAATCSASSSNSDLHLIKPGGYL